MSPGRISSEKIFQKTYWNALYGWYDAGGAANVAAYLARLDLSCFDPKAPPPKTPAFREIVNASRPPEDAELADALDQLGNPKIVTLAQLSNCAPPNFADYLRDRRNARVIPHRLEECGYVRVRGARRSSRANSEACKLIGIANGCSAPLST